MSKRKDIDMTILPEDLKKEKKAKTKPTKIKKVAEKAEESKETSKKKAAEKEVKPERKTQKTSKTAKPKKTTQKPASKNITQQVKHSKSYKEIKKLVDKEKRYTLDEALELLPQTANKKFEESVELHARLNIKLGKGEAGLRTQVVLPHSTGKVIRVAALTTRADAAKKAGATKAGSDDLLEEIKAGKTDFDILITEPSMMPKVAPLAKILGPKGLMPNPKSGTIVPDIEKGVKELAGGKTEIKSDVSGSAHIMVGKVKDSKENLKENIETVLQAINSAPGLSYKGQLIQSLTVCSTMGPGIKLDINNLK